MEEHFGVPQARAVARQMRVQPRLLQTLLEFSRQRALDNVVSLVDSTKLHR